eukprot:UN02365
MLFILLSLLTVHCSAIICYYSSSANTVRCGSSQTCSTVNYADPLPAGPYRVGPSTTFHSGGWFNLYPVVSGNTWDYHTNVASFGCRGGFGLHEGTQSLGCITISHHSCWNSIYNAITGTSVSTQTMDECLSCFISRCWGGISHDTVTRTVYDVTLISS